MRTRLVTFFVLAIFLGPISAKDDLRLGYLEYPPAVYSEQEHVPKGSTIEFLEQNLGQHFEIIWRKIPIGRVQWAFENQIIDAYPFLIRTKEREEWVHYFKKPYMTIQNVICSKKGITKPADSLISLADDFAGSTLVIPLNNTSAKYPFLSDARVAQIKIEFSKYVERSLGLLDLGRADYVYFPSRGPLERGGQINKLSCKNIGKPTGLYFAVAKNNNLAPRLEKIFDALDTQEN